MRAILPCSQFCCTIALAITLFFSLKASSQAWTYRAGYGQSVAGSSEFGKAICTDASGNVYMTGEFAGTVDFGGGGLVSAGAFDGFVASYTSAGAFRWAIRFGGGGSDQGTGIATNGTDIYLTGNFSANLPLMTVGASATTYTSAGNADAFVIKLNASTSATSWVTVFGGTSADIGQAIAVDGQTTGANVYVSGNFNTSATFGAAGVRNAQGGSATDLFVAQLNSSGTIAWASTGGAVSLNDNITGSGICYVPGSGEIVVTGSMRGDASGAVNANYTTVSPVSSVTVTNTNAAANNTDFILLELSASTGAFLSGVDVGGINSDEGLAATYDASTGDVFFTGFFASSSVTFPGNAAITNTGGGGVNNIFYGRYNPSTNAFTWVREVENSTPASANDVGTSITSNGSGAIYVSGYFRNTVSFPTASSPLTLTSASMDDPFLVKLNVATGDAILAKQGSGDDPTTNDRSNGVSFASDGNAWITGQYAGTLSFSSLSGLASSGDGQDIFIAKINDPVAALPLTLIEFSATAQNNEVLIKWKSANEINTEKIEVQHSVEGNSFITIGSVAAAGTSSSDQVYSFIHTNPIKGLNYYRLRIVDKDGKSEFSIIKSVRLSGNQNLVMIYPNPTSNLMKISYQLAGVKTICVYDLAGQKLVQQQEEQNNREVILNVKGLASGTYLLVITHSAGVNTIKFNKL